MTELLIILLGVLLALLVCAGVVELGHIGYDRLEDWLDESNTKPKR